MVIKSFANDHLSQHSANPLQSLATVLPPTLVYQVVSNFHDTVSHLVTVVC